MTQSELDKILMDYCVELDSKGSVNALKFYGLDLIHLDFSGFDLTEAGFRYCFIHDCKFKETNLTASSFDTCSIWRCDFTTAILEEADFNSCDIDVCDFSGAVTKNSTSKTSVFRANTTLNIIGNRWDLSSDLKELYRGENIVDIKELVESGMQRLSSLK